MSEINKNLTDKFLGDIKPKTANQIFCDKNRTYLKLIVRPSGSKSFYYRAKQYGKDLKRKIGDASTMSVATARLIADQQHSEIKTSDSLGLVASNNLQYFTVNHMFELYRENELRLRKTVAGRKHALEVAYNLHVKAELGYRIVKELEKKKFVRFFED